jgi:hypothetical protein
MEGENLGTCRPNSFGSSAPARRITTIGVSNCIAWRHPEYPSTGD